MQLDIRLYAHRGSSALLPENTIPAFAQAIADGANALELDVNCTRDGHFVVVHDPDGNRVADVDARVSQLSLNEVKAWDAGFGFRSAEGNRPYRGRGFEVPTLSEVLTEFPEILVSVDLKPNCPGMVAGLVEEIARHGAERRVILASFHSRVVKRARSIGYPGPTALTRRETASLRVLGIGRRSRSTRIALLPLRAGPLRLDHPHFVSRCRSLGMRVEFWVVNDPDRARALLEVGATGIVTDNPARIAPVIRELSSCRG